MSGTICQADLTGKPQIQVEEKKASSPPEFAFNEVPNWFPVKLHALGLIPCASGHSAVLGSAFNPVGCSVGRWMLDMDMLTQLHICPTRVSVFYRSK